MKKSFAKRLSPQPNSKTKRHSLKENDSTTALRPSPHETSKILTQNNESELTDKQLEGFLKFGLEETRNHSNPHQQSRNLDSVSSIRESIKDILGESIKVNTEIKKIRERIEAKFPFREHSSLKSSQPDFDESSIQASSVKDHSFFLQIDDLKTQLVLLNSRLNNGEAKIRQKNLENFSLQFTICDLTRKLNKLKRKKSAKASRCQIF